MILDAEEKNFGLTKELFARYTIYTQDQMMEGRSQWLSFEDWLQHSFHEREQHSKEAPDIIHEQYGMSSTPNMRHLSRNDMQDSGISLNKLGKSNSLLSLISGAGTPSLPPEGALNRVSEGALVGHPISEGAQTPNEALHLIEEALKRELLKPHTWPILQKTFKLSNKSSRAEIPHRHLYEGLRKIGVTLNPMEVIVLVRRATGCTHQEQETPLATPCNDLLKYFHDLSKKSAGGVFALEDSSDEDDLSMTRYSSNNPDQSPKEIPSQQPNLPVHNIEELNQLYVGHSFEEEEENEKEDPEPKLPPHTKEVANQSYIAETKQEEKSHCAANAFTSAGNHPQMQAEGNTSKPDIEKQMVIKRDDNDDGWNDFGAKPQRNELRTEHKSEILVGSENENDGWKDAVSAPQRNELSPENEHRLSIGGDKDDSWDDVGAKPQRNEPRTEQNNQISIGSENENDGWQDAVSAPQRNELSPEYKHRLSIGGDKDDSWNDVGLTINTEKATGSGLPPRHTSDTPSFRQPPSPILGTEKESGSKRGSTMSAFYSAEDTGHMALKDDDIEDQDPKKPKSPTFHTPNQSLASETLQKKPTQANAGGKLTQSNADKKPAQANAGVPDILGHDDFSDLSEDELL